MRHGVTMIEDMEEDLTRRKAILQSVEPEVKKVVTTLGTAVDTSVIRSILDSAANPGKKNPVKLASYEKIYENGYCKDYKSLPDVEEHRWSLPLSPGDDLYNEDKVQECANKCFKAAEDPTTG